MEQLDGARRRRRRGGREAERRDGRGHRGPRQPQLVQTLLENDLIDELRVMVFPVVLGTGKRLFGHTSDKKRLKLTDSRTVGEGIVILVYEPV